MKKKAIIKIVEDAYKKYYVTNENGEHLIIEGVRLNTLINHPISAMRAEIIEELQKIGMKKASKTNLTKVKNDKNSNMDR